jgi:hypothetical protein
MGETASYKGPDGQAWMHVGTVMAKVEVHINGVGQFGRRFWFRRLTERARQCFDAFVDEFERIEDVEMTPPSFSPHDARQPAPTTGDNDG